MSDALPSATCAPLPMAGAPSRPPSERGAMSASEAWWLVAAVLSAVAAVAGFTDYRPPHGNRAGLALTSVALACVAIGFIVAYP